MMDIKEDEDVLGSRNYTVRTRVNCGSSGAGVNADERVDMAFAASDPLSELVWSPHSGLSLRCADSSLFLLPRNVESTLQDLSTSPAGKMEEEDRNDDVFGSQNVRIADVVESSKRNAEQDSLSEGIHGSRVVKDLSRKSSVPLPNLQSQAELDDEVTSMTLMKQDSSAEKEDRLEASLAVDPYLTYRDKGKEKAVSDDQDNSHESVESCNSARSFSRARGVKRHNYDQDKELVETKRMKPDSSFIKWISNMVKGMPGDSSKDEDKSPALAANVMPSKADDDCMQTPNMGFQTMFQSLYSCRRNTRMSVSLPKGDNSTAADENPMENSCKQIIVPSKPSEIPSVPLEKRLEKKKNPLASLWITRLYTQTPITEPDDQKRVVDKDDSSENKAIASVFAKRVDALRHITHPLNSLTGSIMCFFCGGGGHDLSKCPQLTETELEDVLMKISSFNGGDGDHCLRLCIRCFQFDHWAVSCPLGSSDVGFSRKRLSSSYEYKTSSRETDLKLEKQKLRCNSVAGEDMFGAIRKLRLSRSDILRWMRSNNASVSHLYGFFLRLRVGKLEAGVRGSRYYVASITGVTMEKNMISNDSNFKIKSILVDVGGIKSLVGSQHVSNHDFLDDEIKAWWSTTLSSGGKIPSMDELNSKLERKKCLGF